MVGIRKYFCFWTSTGGKLASPAWCTTTLLLIVDANEMVRTLWGWTHRNNWEGGTWRTVCSVVFVAVYRPEEEWNFKIASHIGWGRNWWKVGLSQSAVDDVCLYKREIETDRGNIFAHMAIIDWRLLNSVNIGTNLAARYSTCHI